MDQGTADKKFLFWWGGKVRGRLGKMQVQVRVKIRTGEREK